MAGRCASLVAGGAWCPRGVGGVLVVAGGGWCPRGGWWCPRGVGGVLVVAGGASLVAGGASRPPAAYCSRAPRQGHAPTPQRGGHSPSKSKFQRNKNKRLLLYISII